MGVFYGITTNPLLTARAGLTYEDVSWENLLEIAADVGAKEFHGDDPDFDIRLNFIDKSIISLILDIPSS